LIEKTAQKMPIATSLLSQAPASLRFATSHANNEDSEKLIERHNYSGRELHDERKVSALPPPSNSCTNPGRPPTPVKTNSKSSARQNDFAKAPRMLISLREV
jgi:hypothetical protein